MIKVAYVDHMGSDLSVVNAARVSFGKKKDILDDSDRRLIAYLAKHKHTSPFGHAFSSFHITAPIFVARQLVKHKFLRWNEVSRRYVSYDPEFYKPTLRVASADKKQGSGVEMPFDVHRHSVMTHIEIESLKRYRYMLAEGVCEEQARMFLPQNMMTEWYWSGSLDAFADMCNLRCKADTQQETSEVAIQVDEIMEGLFPISWKELRK